MEKDTIFRVEFLAFDDSWRQLLDTKDIKKANYWCDILQSKGYDTRIFEGVREWTQIGFQSGNHLVEAQVPDAEVSEKCG